MPDTPSNAATVPTEPARKGNTTPARITALRADYEAFLSKTALLGRHGTALVNAAPNLLDEIEYLHDLITSERALHEDTIERARRAENALRGIRLMARQWAAYPLDGLDDSPAAEALGKAGRALLDLLADHGHARPHHTGD